MSILVGDIRNWEKRSEAPKAFCCPGCYTWWANEKTCQTLLGDYHVNLWPLLTEGKGDCEGMKMVYAGITTKMTLWERVCKWHIQETHSLSKVRHKTLSTLRQSLCSLLGDNWMDDKSLNRLQDTMRVDVHPIDLPIRSPDLIEKTHKIEMELIKNNLLTLNIKDNHHPDVQEFKKHLKERRSISRRATLQGEGIDP